VSNERQNPYQVFVRTEMTPFPCWARGVEGEADVALWCPFKCLLTRTVPPRYTEGWHTRLRNQYQRELTALADALNLLKGKEKQKLLAKLAKERAVQENVLAALRTKGVKRQSAPRADFGNVNAHVRISSFSPVDRIEGYW
jgi:hypothetical protein